MGGFYILIGSILEKCGKFWKNGRFSWRIWPDWGNAAQADLAGLGSIGIRIGAGIVIGAHLVAAAASCFHELVSIIGSYSYWVSLNIVNYKLFLPISFIM